MSSDSILAWSIRYAVDSAYPLIKENIWVVTPHGSAGAFTAVFSCSEVNSSNPWLSMNLGMS